MTISAIDVYRADFEGQRRLANLNRPRVPIAPEVIDGALCLWRTNGDGSHTDTIRLPAISRPLVAQLLQGASMSAHRVRGGSISIRAVEHGITEEDQDLLNRLAIAPASTGYLMARSLETARFDSSATLAEGFTVRITATPAEYLEARDLTDRIFRSRQGPYVPESDFYNNAPTIQPQIAAFWNGRIVAAASMLIVDGIANIGSVCTDPANRGLGIASAVIDEACAQARRCGARHACLGTTNELSRVGGLYHRLGFRTVGREFGWTIRNVDSLPA